MINTNLTDRNTKVTNRLNSVLSSKQSANASTQREASIPYQGQPTFDALEHGGQDINASIDRSEDESASVFDLHSTTSQLAARRLSKGSHLDTSPNRLMQQMMDKSPKHITPSGKRGTYLAFSKAKNLPHPNAFLRGPDGKPKQDFLEQT